MTETRFIIAGRFIDGSGGRVHRNVFLAVEDGIITAIDSTANLPHPDEAVIHDLSHCTILPALVDCSVSLTKSPSVLKSVRLDAEEADFTKKAAILEQHIQDCHAHGVQGVADGDDITDLLEHSQEGAVPGSIISIKTSGSLCLNGQDYAADNSPDGDFLKLNYSNNIESAEETHSPLSHDDLCRILQQKTNKKTVVVANGRQKVEEALESGCDAIEQGYHMGEENLRKMAEQNILWIPSLLRSKNALDGASTSGNVCCRFSLRYVAPGKPIPGAEAFWKKMLTDQLAQLRFARKIGLRTALGTGAGSAGILHGESMVDEMKLFIKAGYSLEETIRCASENGARFFDMEKLGMLTVGRRATFLITRGTVKQLPRKLAYLEGIYIDGLPSTTYHKNPSRSAYQA